MKRAHNFRDITGQVFNRWTVMGFACIELSGGKKKSVWTCRCLCGVVKNIRLGSIVNGDSKSCGCLQKERTRAMGKLHNTKHGMRNSRLYSIWRAMKKRCYQKTHCGYRNYGGRGIVVCERWHNFKQFMEDMYVSYLQHVDKYSEKETSIDRINNDGNYEPANCRWATLSQQHRNTRPKKRNNLGRFI